MGKRYMLLSDAIGASMQAAILASASFGRTEIVGWG